jgi:hypothetical protein
MTWRSALRDTVNEWSVQAKTMENCSVADPGSGAFLTPSSGMGKKSRCGSGIWIQGELPGSYFREPKNNFLE